MRLRDIKENMSHADVTHEVARLVAHWKEHGKGMSDVQLADAIGNDLEQVEYAPRDVEKLVPHIVAKVKSG